MSVKKVKQTRVMGYNGVHILISTVQYPTGEYETVALNESECVDLNMLQSGDLEQHKKTHKDWVEKYGFYTLKAKKEIKDVKDIPQKYKAFAADYVEAVRFMQQDSVYKLSKDGGTCNFDSPSVFLGGFREDFLQMAVKEHSSVLGVLKDGKGWFTLKIPKNSSQGEHRTYQAKYIANALSDKGYKTSVEYRMD